MALFPTNLLDSVIESVGNLDKREVEKLAKRFITMDTLPMGDIQRWLEQRWRPEASDFLAPGSITADLLEAVPHVCVGRAAAQSIASGVFTTTEDIVFDTAIDANTTMWTTGKTVTLPRAGVWFLSGTIYYNTVTVSKKSVYILANGATIRRNEIDGGQIQPVTAVTRRLAAGTAITMRAFQSTGVAVNTVAAAEVNALSATWVGN